MQIAFSETLPFFLSNISKAITQSGVKDGSVLFSNIQEILYIILYGISFFLPTLLIFKFTEKPSKHISFRISFPKYAVFLFIGALGCVSLSGEITNVLNMLLSKIGIGFKNYTPDIPDNILGIILLFVSLVILPAIFEEILFRKAILNALLPYGTFFALIVSSLSFSLMHKNPSQFLYTFIGGLFFGYIAIQSRSVIPTIVLHFINNGLAVTYLMMEKYANQNTYISFVSTTETILKISGIFFLVLLLAKKWRNNKNDLPAKKELPLKSALTVFSITFIVYCIYFSKDWIYFI